MFKNGQLVKCVSSSGSIHIAEGEYYRVSHDSGKEICLVGIPGYYHSDAFTPHYYNLKPGETVNHNNYIDEGVGVFIKTPKPDKYETLVDKGVTALRKNLMTLPTTSKERKDYPLLNGCIRYFPAALAGVALISKKGNDKHNPGEDLHHARSKSMDHGDCIVRHLIDVQDLLKTYDKAAILEEVDQLAWRVLAYSQELHEKFGAPLAPGAKK